MNNSPPNRELSIRGVPMPEVHVFRAAKPDGSALLSVPGGGYGFLAVQNEGIDVADRFNAERTTVFVLTYRLPTEGWANRAQVPLQDAQRAMRLIRARAADLRIDPARLGVLGFSAGGHLAADLAVSFEQRIYAPVDAADRQVRAACLRRADLPGGDALSRRSATVFPATICSVLERRFS